VRDAERVRYASTSSSCPSVRPQLGGERGTGTRDAHSALLADTPSTAGVRECACRGWMRRDQTIVMCFCGTARRVRSLLFHLFTFSVQRRAKQLDV